MSEWITCYQHLKKKTKTKISINNFKRAEIIQVGNVNANIYFKDYKYLYSMVIRYWTTEKSFYEK